ncbi:MAG: hypothetical protein KKC84_05080, partial [Candidatus Omnitrophica bacterium]|nr:hypothetical protein [Candidatus Omnitrophota bacterium]
EFHDDKVILELDDLLRPHDVMYVMLKDIRDISGNTVSRGYRGASYSVPSVPLHLELRPSASSQAVNSAISVSVTARCLSGRVLQFVNNRFTLQVTESVPDESTQLSPAQVLMQDGVGEFKINDSSAETVRVTVSDPENAVPSASLELEFR